MGSDFRNQVGFSNLFLLHRLSSFFKSGSRLYRKSVPAWIFSLAFILFLSAQYALGSETIPCILKSPEQRTNLGVNNFESTEAAVSLLLFDNTGRRLAERAIKVPPNGYYSVSDVISFTLGIPQGDPFEGYLQLDSNSRISAFASQIDNRNNEPRFIPSVSSGSNHLYIPQITSLGSWQTFLAIVNLSDTAGQIRLIFRDPSGQVFLTAQRDLAAHSQWIAEDLYRELTVPDQEGALEIESTTGILLAAVVRLVSTDEQVQTVLVPAFDLNGAAEQLSVPYVFTETSEVFRILLLNPGDPDVPVRLKAFDPNGKLVSSLTGTVPSKATVWFSQEEIFPAKTTTARYGLIQLNSDQPMVGIAVTTVVSTGNRNYVPFVPEGSPELLIPAAIQVPPFYSRLLVVNFSNSAARIRMQVRNSAGGPAGSVFDSTLPGLGALKLDEVLPALSIRDRFFGPLSISSLLGQPIAALSQISTSPGWAGGGLSTLDSRPVTRKKAGESFTLSWNYGPQEISGIQEFRVYRAKRADRIFERITTVPPTELEYKTQSPEPGEHCYVVKAFDGVKESLPSNEVIVVVDLARN
jgi:hypothetical protein